MVEKHFLLIQFVLLRLFKVELHFLNGNIVLIAEQHGKILQMGKNGLAISSSTLIVSKTCDLYTDAITVISFKCLSNNSAYYDIITISKLEIVFQN